ncbi:Uncharacterised protein [Mycobacteroides abscessus subsp. abscessus]|nr:Uncharacterised protein [Mycobacteroides abscessus subsp. abscessus]
MRVGRDGRRIESRILDVVTHRGHELIAQRLDVHECSTMIEPEFTVQRIVDPVSKVHELWRSADIEL